MNEQIIILQPNKLRQVDDLVTAKQFDDLMDCSLTSLRSIPIIMPDVNREALKNLGIIVEKLDIFSLSEDERQQQLSELALTYAKVFAGEPWNEVSRCEKTGKFFPDIPGKPCFCCGITTSEAYPIDQTMAYITEELSKPNAVCMVVRDGEKIVGAAWGYNYETPDAFVQEKYPPQMQGEIISALEKVGITKKFFYMSESFILPAEDESGNSRYRGKGILNAFYQMFVFAAQELNLPMLGRTTIDSKQVNNALLNFGFELIHGPKLISDRRQIRVIENTYVAGVDKQNEKRVLYALGSSK